MSRAQLLAGAMLFSLLVAGAAFVGGAGAATAEDVTLTVTVVDQDGDPVGNADLSATWDGGGPVNRTTASNGKAFVDVQAGADVTVGVDHADYVRNRPFEIDDASEEDVEIDVAQKGEATVVVENESGRVENASVQLRRDDRTVVSGRTDATGEFETGAVERGEYSLTTVKEGYRRNESTLDVGAAVRTTQTMRQDSVLVTFSVTDDHFEQPRAVQNARVILRDDIDVTTQANGRITVSVPVNDEYSVQISKPGYRSVGRLLSVGESRTSLNVSVRREPAISATGDRDRVVVGESVRITVTDEYGDPVSNAAVSRDGSDVGTTADDGTVEVPIESAGNHTVSALFNGLEASLTVEGVEPASDETAMATDEPTATPTDIPTVTATPTETPTDVPTTATTSGDGPGFGLATVLAALLAITALAHRRAR